MRQTMNTTSHTFRTRRTQHKSLCRFVSGSGEYCGMRDFDCAHASLHTHTTRMPQRRRQRHTMVGCDVMRRTTAQFRKAWMRWFVGWKLFRAHCFDLTTCDRNAACFVGLVSMSTHIWVSNIWLTLIYVWYLRVRTKCVHQCAVYPLGIIRPTPLPKQCFLNKLLFPGVCKITTLRNKL